MAPELAAVAHSSMILLLEERSERSMILLARSSVTMEELGRSERPSSEGDVVGTTLGQQGNDKRDSAIAAIHHTIPQL